MRRHRAAPLALLALGLLVAACTSSAPPSPSSGSPGPGSPGPGSSGPGSSGSGSSGSGSSGSGSSGSGSSGSGSSGPATATATPGPTTVAGCRWGAAALSAAGRVLVLSGHAYELIDTSTLRVLRRCEAGPAASWAPPELGVQGVTYRGSKAESTDPVQWPGVLRPGGPHASVVLVAGGVLDLATGVRMPVAVPGFRPQSVGRGAVVMMSTRARGPLPPTTAASWCTAPLASPTTCTPITAASGPGTPVVGADGRIAWLGTELTASRVPVPGTSTKHLIRSGAGVITAVGVPAAPNGVVLLGRAVTPDGRAFVTVGSLPTTQRSAFPPDPHVTWYGADGRTHRARATWIQVGSAGGISGAVVRGSVAVSADARTLYVVLASTANARQPSLVAVTDGGSARRLGRAPGAGRALQFGDELLSAPSGASR